MNMLIIQAVIVKQTEFFAEKCWKLCYTSCDIIFKENIRNEVCVVLK
jgi:hypothetical protein